MSTGLKETAIEAIMVEDDEIDRIADKHNLELSTRDKQRMKEALEALLEQHVEDLSEDELALVLEGEEGQKTGGGESFMLEEAVVAYAEARDDGEAVDSTGQKTAAATDNIAEQIKARAAEYLEEQVRDRVVEENSNDLGEIKNNIHDPDNRVTDDVGKRRQRSRGLSPGERRRRLKEVEEMGGEGPRGGHPSDNDDEGEGDVDPRIDEVASGEGW